MKYILKNRKRTGIVIGLILVTVLCIGCSGKENTKKRPCKSVRYSSMVVFSQFLVVQENRKLKR